MTPDEYFDLLKIKYDIIAKGNSIGTFSSFKDNSGGELKHIKEGEVEKQLDKKIMSEKFPCTFRLKKGKK